MATGAGHEIVDLARSTGELVFEARIAGTEPRQVWFRTETEVQPGVDAALAACLMPAMRAGGKLKMSVAVSPRLLRDQAEYQAIQRAWSFDWTYDEEALREVEVEAPTAVPNASSPTGRVAAFFSGGVDSFAAVLANPEVTDLIFVRGFDILPWLDHHEGLADEVEARMREAASELGLPLHVVDTNLRELSDPLIRWECNCTSALAAVAHFLGPLFDRVLIATDSDHETMPPMTSALMVDQLWSSENLEIADWGGRLSREQRTEAIAEHPVVRRTLRTCWENLGGAYNCGRCRKCLLTMVSLEAIGARERVTAFPPDLDLSPLAESEISQPIALTLWEDLLDHARDRGRADLAAPLEAFVTKGRRTMGLAQSYRTRQSRHGRRERGTGVRLEAAEAELATVLASRSWRWTEPLRRLGAWLRSRAC
ncbi:MAG TPA: hypothetical protein VFZ29_10775 [Solirubrobacterales bacterium]